MKPPAKVLVGPHAYGVRLDGDGLTAAGVEAGLRLSGLTRHSSLEILVDPDLASTEERETVLHEVLHALFSLTRMSGEDEEETISRLSPVLLDLLRRNPRLIAYLVEK